MHGELIFQHSSDTEPVRAAGNATLLGDQTVRWEFHDRGLGDERLDRVLDKLARVREAGGSVSVSYIETSPPLEEVESGPQVADEHSAAVDYRVVELDRERGQAVLQPVGSGAGG